MNMQDEEESKANGQTNAVEGQDADKVIDENSPVA